MFKLNDYNHILKIGFGPNIMINFAAYRACSKIADIIKNTVNIYEIEVRLYNEFARSYKETEVDKDILSAFKGLKAPIKIVTNVAPEKPLEEPLVFDVFIWEKGRKNIWSYRVVSIGTGSFSIDGVEEPYHYKPEPLIRTVQFCQLHPKLSYLQVLCDNNEEMYQAVKAHLKECMRIMNKIIDDGLKAEGLLPLKDKKIKYYVKAKNIYENVRKNETDDQEMIRLVSAYAYAIGEQIPLKRKFVASPSGSSSACILWSVLRYLYEKYKPSQEKMLNAIAAASMICGNIMFGSPISSYAGGCQADMATACAMATAAACVIIYDAKYDEIGRAAEMAIEHSYGLICNSICSIPLVPCIQRAASFACRAIELATINHSLMPTKELVRFDDATVVLAETGKDLATKHKVAGFDGFATSARYSLYPNETKKKGKK